MAIIIFLLQKSLQKLAEFKTNENSLKFRIIYLDVIDGATYQNYFN